MKNRAFTLIEMMMVLIIIGILMGLTLAAVFTALKSAKVSNAEADIATLEASISMYEVDVGDYPPEGTTDCSGDNLFKTWLQDGDGSTGWNGPYRNFKAIDLTGQKLKDPWGNPYQYGKGTGAANNSKFVDIYSFGPDGIDNSGAPDDIKNW